MILRLILGDQLNYQHTWFKEKNNDVLYALMEIKQETEYVKHHIQKIIGFFMAMRQFSNYLRENGHKVIYLKISDQQNKQSLNKNLDDIIETNNIKHFEYLLPDEYRLDQQLKNYSENLNISFKAYDTEHFYTNRNEVRSFFNGSKQILMERFYRHMRKKHNILMDGNKPVGNNWNFDKQNRKKIPENHKIPKTQLYEHNVTSILSEIKNQEIDFFGEIEPNTFIWPVNRDECLRLLYFFVDNLLVHFGDFQDAMTTRDWGLYHSRLSFALNTKMLHPGEVIHAVINGWNSEKDAIDISQVEGFIRQILGWREFMRGVYWWQMPEYEQINYLNHKRKLPWFYWSGETRMNCMHHAIKQSLDKAYAHHIQRLMVTGNFSLLAGVDPKFVDEWYLGVYIDAIQWVEITNTRGMSQFADGGIIATKPYISSASYINKMSNYCTSCYYNHKKKHGDKACPFNSLYWNFFEEHSEKFKDNQRLKMMYSVWNRMKSEEKSEILKQADYYLKHLEKL